MNETLKERIHTVLLTLIFITDLALYIDISANGSTLINKPSELECRNSKLFEVTHEGNITIYDPTYDDCEVRNEQ